MHPGQRRIVHIVGRIAYVGLLLALIGCVIALTGMADRPRGQVPRFVADAQLLSEAPRRTPTVTAPAGRGPAPRKDAISIAPRERRHWQDRSAAQHATIHPTLDRDRDRRADLMDMAIAIRWHRGAATELPPGSD